ncbi:cyclic nucleotide-binding domain (cNMP-BD) protein [Sulfurimonas gotlandica GD1]|uniref:Cyclic nucleotide-binding domain (CNMP-BD) protein n=1 Tax=Sulfurimonas gotlandica (strain DSM 19862 / JCM 16533 / GD1) TaxID=929558 RepID=B6BKQ5_SULGG|nr:Crp/Fnr family transcriptional regulator [Sulfurimonas gotlandica]EDZ62350.1 cyclic nucleotide-binding domain protein [Sulfurimonas gotlandica GD1]EHP29114.1 cyclic nucleotide-binding domain (cNMP-BD) protein [Sulfurimonas gotlandica GD1]
MSEEKLESIKKLNFFKSLDDNQIKEIKDISNIVEYPKGSILYYENDTSNKIFFLVSGVLKVYKIDKFENEIFLYHIHKNSLISELTSLDSDSIYCYSNSEFMEDSVILEVNFTEFKKRFLANNILNNEFINEILLKTHQLHCVVNRELVFDATAKVAFMLSDDLEMFNSLKRQDVSFMLHIQPETLSRVLKKLKRSNIIEVENSNVSILDLEQLNNIFKGDQL